MKLVVCVTENKIFKVTVVSFMEIYHLVDFESEKLTDDACNFQHPQSRLPSSAVGKLLSGRKTPNTGSIFHIKPPSFTGKKYFVFKIALAE